MQINSAVASPLQFETPCLVVPLWQDEALSGQSAEIDRALRGLIAEVISDDGFLAGNGETRILHTRDQLPAPRVVLVGLGKKSAFNLAKLRQTMARAARVVRGLKRSEFAVLLPVFDQIPSMDAGRAVAEALTLGLHEFNDYKAKPQSPTTEVTSVTLLTQQVEPVREGVAFGQLLARANLRVRGWVNLPSNLKSPQFLAEQAQQIAARNSLRCEVWDENRIAQERMGALYAVGMGSDQPPRFIVLEYAPAGHEQDAPLILVGKGMTFDTGGYSIKPSASMEDMKDDMAGAAVVLGVMSAVAALAPGRRVIGVIASAENMINGHAQRPGDIVTARNGKTIEVLNTDAEGRLILADALSWASEQQPAAIIDYATLTGAIGIALGQEAAGIFSNDAALEQSLVAAGEVTGERLWPFPMWDEYKEHVKGTISDLKNIGLERRAGSIAGAVFLENFVAAGIPWAHLDIAAVSLIREDRPLCARGATGFGVGLTLEMLGRSRS